MNSHQLLCALSSDPIAQLFRIRICAIDQLPNRVDSYPSGWIVNNQPSNREGQHWLALWIPNSTYAEFFDSFGKPPSYYGLDVFLERLNLRYRYNNQSLQNEYSQTCGLYVLFYLMMKTRGYALARIQDEFGTDTKVNDDRICEFAKHYFNRCL